MQTALITGATDGIGKATAKKLLSEGWKVVIIGRNPDKCKATVSELKLISKEIKAIVCAHSITSLYSMEYSLYGIYLN